MEGLTTARWLPGFFATGRKLQIQFITLVLFAGAFR